MATLEGKSVLIVGGSSGIGFGVAKAALLSLAEKVIIASSSQAKIDNALERLRAETVGKKLPGKASGAVLNAKEIRNVEAFFGNIGEIDHLVWTSGDALKRGWKDVDIESLKDTFDVRFWGPAVAAQKAKIKSGGSITLTTGQAVVRPRPGYAIIAGVGGATDSMTRGLALDLAPIRVNVISPGLIRTELWDNPNTPPELIQQFLSFSDKLPVKHIGTPEEVAEAYLFVMKCTYITGQTIEVDGGHKYI